MRELFSNIGLAGTGGLRAAGGGFLCPVLLLGLLLGLAAPSSARASGCYTCANNSAPACKDYCAYSGADTFDNRHRCQAKGCKISGTSACPGQGSTAKICIEEKTPTVQVAAIPWCVAPARDRS